MKVTEKRAVQGTHDASMTLLYGEGATILGGAAYLRRLTCGPRTVWVVQYLGSLRLSFVLGLEPVSPRVRQEAKGLEAGPVWVGSCAWGKAAA